MNNLNQNDNDIIVTLETNENGKPKNTISNFISIIKQDEYFASLQFNELSNSPEKITNNKIELWTDTDDSMARNYIEKKYRILNQKALEDALRIVFKERTYHPIKRAIESVQWDGNQRISTLLIKWLGCDNNSYSRELSRLIFAGGINRLYNAGCKFDDVVVLTGEQGAGKSTFVRFLALNDDFYSEVTEIDGQKGMESVEGSWIIEIGELLALNKAKDVESIKAYISRQKDKYRRPYDRRVTMNNRQCIFIGTTNKSQFLTDKTGNRRFYPLTVANVGYSLFENQEELKADIIQCWAEAKAKYDRGEMVPCADKNLTNIIKERQENALEDDYREGLIFSYLKDKSETCVIDIWTNALTNQNKPTRKDSNEITSILQNCKEWEPNNRKRFHEFGQQRVWTKRTQTPLYQLDSCDNDNKLNC